MKKALATLLATILCPAGSLEAAGAAVRAAAARARVVPLPAALPAARGLGTLSSSGLLPGLPVRAPAARPMETSAPAVLGVADSLPRAALPVAERLKPLSAAAPAALPRRASFPSAGRRRPASARARLSGMAEPSGPAGFRFAPAGEAKGRLDAVWDGSASAGRRSVLPGKRPSYLRPALGRPGPRRGKEERAVPLFGAAAAPLAGLGLERLGALPEWAQTSLTVAGILLGTHLLSRTVRWGLRRAVSKTEWSPILEAWLVRGGAAVVWAGGAAWALSELGVSASALAANAGLTGLAVGIAVQDVARNLGSGLMLFINAVWSGKPFRLGDLIEADGVKGRVSAFNTRFTVLDLSGDPAAEFARVLIPNEKVRAKEVLNARDAAALGGAGLLWLGGAWAPGLVLGAQLAGIAVGSWVLAKALRFLARRALAVPGEAQDGPERAKREWLASMAGASAYLIGLAASLHVLGLSLSSLVAGLGVLSVAAGLLAKDMATNLVAGLVLAVYRPFRLDDRIQVGGRKGRVADITHDYISLELDDGGGFKAVHIPMAKVLTEKIYVGEGPAFRR